MTGHCHATVPEIIVIVQAHQDTQVHVCYSNQDAHLHLQAVQIWQLSLGTAPNRVHTKGVWVRALKSHFPTSI
jgi:hypothetical protein